MNFAAAFEWFKPDTASETAFDPYKTLGISRWTGNDQIKRAYRKLAMQYHPDIGGDAIRITQINVAYNMIRKKRGF